MKRTDCSQIACRRMDLFRIKVTGKQHAHVLRDIKTIIEQGVSASNFGLAEYKDQQGKMRLMIL